MNILTFSTLFPNSERPGLGIFVKHRAFALAARDGIEVRVIAPIPYFPAWLDWSFIPGDWRTAARVPTVETLAGIRTWHPRFFNPPKIGMPWYADWMAWGAFATVQRLHAERPIDLIDAHYAYPDGAAAIAIGRRLGIPVSITARGTDINLFSRMRFIQPLVASALRGAAAIIAVSDALRARMLELGIERDKVAVIRNGIDTHAFRRRPQITARRELGLAPNARILLAVSALVPLKGIDRLIDAIAILDDPSAELIIVGQGAERDALQNRIDRQGLNQRVKMVGAKSQEELAIWYSASDIFCLASHREGCPNVIIEALTCGVPVVAADVGGVRELVSDKRFGFLVPEHGSAREFAMRMQEALAHRWNRDEIAARGGSRSWTRVAQEVVDYWSARKLC